MTCVSGDCPGQWTAMPPGDGTSCYTVPAGATRVVNFRFENSDSSANLKFEADVTFTWGHECPCSLDEHNHPAITQRIYVPSTKPQDCPCGAYGNTEMTSEPVSVQAEEAADTNAEVANQEPAEDANPAATQTEPADVESPEAESVEAPNAGATDAESAESAHPDAEPEA